MTGMGSDGTEGVKKMVASEYTKVIAEKKNHILEQTISH
ncbi:hypothetical protein ACEQPO_13210 [Bacillus sp. SL00103]